MSFRRKSIMKYFMVDLASPKNMSYFWNFGSILGLNLVNQLMTGLFLACFYMPSTSLAFDSIKLMKRDIWSGSLVRFLHMAGSSSFFLFLFLHMGRGFYYFSFMKSSVWLCGFMILILSMGTAFLGYVLPWGQMSYWGATVITKFLSVMPLFGKFLVKWVWGGYSVKSPTLTRFFALHFLLPFVLIFFIILHLTFMHSKGTTNPLGMMSFTDYLFFHPYFIMKDFFGFFILLFWIIIFLLIPQNFLEYQNFLEANPLVTPKHIQPEWYFLSSYAVLRAVPNKLGGVVSLLLFLLMCWLLPFYMKSSKTLNSLSFSLLNQFIYWIWVSNFIFLTWLGSLPVEDPYVLISQLSSLFYFINLIMLSWLLQKY